ncbi:hypothetical protein Tco_1450769, partial [Tanacetum coccineum]
DDGGDKVVTAVGVAVVEGDGGEGVAVTRWYWCGVVEMTMMMASFGDGGDDGDGCDAWL